MTPRPQGSTPAEFGEAVAAEVRAEMARQRKTKKDLAAALGITEPTARRRLDNSSPFDTVELAEVAHWLGVRPEQFYPTEAAS